MSCPARVLQWHQEVSTAFAHLSKPQVWGLVLWSAGMALAGTAGITQISALLAVLLQQQEQAVFQRWREWSSLCTAEERKKAPAIGGDFVFCVLAAMDRSPGGTGE